MKPPLPPAQEPRGKPKRAAGAERTLIDPQSPATASGEPSTAENKIELAPGLRIEQYELIRELGRGGMGQVWLARDNKLGRRVAMKFVASTGSSGKKFVERFLVEARATAACAYEHIVVIHEVAEYLGMPYMVLEYVEGSPLGKLMTERRMPASRAIELVVPVARALAYAHGKGIVHRDLKPDNIVVTASGTVKVLDFGIAKLFQAPDDAAAPRRAPTASIDLSSTRVGAIVGTLPYMSPEQLGTDTVDHRSDLWAIGIILYEMLAGRHPLEPITQGKLFGAAAALDEPMPSLADDVAGLPDRLVQIVARCLAKRKADRYASADELLADLEPLLPRRTGRGLAADENPYPGLTAFQESDAARFFGRTADIASVVARLRDQPVVAVVGPSGVGKSSFVRAGVAPALKASGEAWEVMIVRPGRQPLTALASTLESLRDSRDSDPVLGDDATARLRGEPGVFGARLRARARRKRTQILVFVDQHEELYTLVPDLAERRAFTACLAGAADDPSGPLRVIVSMRSDFLDRAAEDRRFVEELTRGLVFLQPPSAAGLEEALVQPLAAVGYAFEDGVVDAMVEQLEQTPGSLPLLQFTAARLWETRDRARRVLTRDSYTALGGVAGALATHADEVVNAYSADDKKLVRTIFQRLVTPERTRAIVDTGELREVSPEIERIVAHLVEARLLVVHARGDDGAAAIELVHESLIHSWPRLARWLDEDHEDAAFLAQLRAAAKQWEQMGRAQGLLWRDEAMLEARRWRARYQRELPAREQAFLDAVFAAAARAGRRKRAIVGGVIAALVAGVAVVGTLYVRADAAEHEAELATQRAEQALQRAEAEKQRIEQQDAELVRKENERVAAEAAKAKAVADEQAAKAKQTLAEQQKQAAAAQAAIAEANRAKAQDAAAAARARAAQAELDKKKLQDEQRRKKDKQSGKISTGDLK